MPFVLLLIALAVPAPLVAQGVPQRPTPIEIRETRSIPRDVADDVASIFNGQGVRRVSGDVVIGEGEVVDGDLAILDGTLTVAGRVTGRVAGINVDVRLQPSARLERDLLIVGGQLDAGGGEVAGDIRIYRDRMEIERLSDRIIVHDAPDEPEALNGQLPRRSRWRGELRFVSARTYN
ncbi:MAG TPA: polymer-forming cytoskeletal protein, partial [Gemmatimonadaceae bacterium]